MLGWTIVDETYIFRLANIGEEQEEIEVTPISIPVEAPIPTSPIEVPEKELEPV